MALHFCKTCGTVYDDKVGGCPKCATAEVMQEVTDNTYCPPQSDMTEEEVAKARKKDWIGILIGIPCFIAFIYLIIFLFKMVKGG